jgi:GT2 family glycosyltransferase
MYRVEVATSIGGYCRKLSQVGHREESDFSYRFHLAGYRQYIQPKAAGYHFCIPGGGIRSGDIVDKNALAAADHQIYVNRIAKWKRQLEQRKRLEAGQGKAPEASATHKPDAEPQAPTVTKGKMAAVINGGRDVARIQRAIDRLSGIAHEVYVTCEDEAAKESLFGDKLAMVACSPDESAMLAKQLASAGDHEFVMTVPDTLVFQRDPRPMLDDAHDNYVFEVYRTYMPGRHRQDGGQSVFVQDEGIGTVIGPECRNMCLICRRGASSAPVDMGRTKYLDMLAWEDERLVPVDGKSVAGNDLLPVRDMERVDWRKVCVYQFPEGKIKEPFYMDVKASDTPLVSIVIPTIDRCKLLKKCIDSIYAFTTTPFEIIIVDNNSSDGTFKLMEDQQFRGNLHGLRLNMNVGYQRAVNMGIENAKGKYLLLFNDDAWVEKYWKDGRDWLRVMIDDLEADPTIGIIGPHEGTSPALGSHVLYFWCVMMKRSFYDEIGHLDDSTFFNYGGDDDYCERTRKAGYKVQYKHGYDSDGVLRHLMNLVPKEKQAPEMEESRRKLLEKYRK